MKKERKAAMFMYQRYLRCVVSKVIITKILAAKSKEIECGVDGFMVYDARVVPQINETPLEDDPKVVVTAKLVEKSAASFAAHAHKNLCRSNAERKRLTAARYMCMELFLSRNPPEFITSYLNDNHKFRTLHNKALLSNL
ncbi:hypothetical protein HF086_001828 [Spodoptera exigua]|uniref:Uncharacterized protein n=1 Tax=Spodoptera exigua TaxID=7107 RepID=A0A922MVI0_SPOEX|nr:hypothetical protein HF086_001828 [Spodoptera exigua]